ncbi:MAG: ROK family protein [Gemmatimonadaceae bacterium]
MLRVRTSGRHAVAVDVRPGKTSIALADFGGGVLERRSFETPREPAELARQLVAHVEEVLNTRASGDGDPATIHGLGIVVPGMVDRRSGQILYAPRLGWRDVQLRDAVREHLDVPVSVESAPIACALARLWLMTGEPRSVNNFAYVSVSDGVGVGIVVSGEVLRGEHHTAGELGHVSLDPNGPRCACGKRGSARAANPGRARRAYADRRRARHARVPRFQSGRVPLARRRGARGGAIVRCASRGLERAEAREKREKGLSAE